jgi:hypothetical protein
MVSLIPSDSYLIINFDLPSIVKQPELKALIEDHMEKSGAQNYSDFYQKAGIVPTRDIKNVTIFVTRNEKSGILVSGNFDVKEISKLIQTDQGLSKSFHVSEIAGLQAVKNDSNPYANMVFVNNNTVAFGPEEVLAKVAMIQNRKASSIVRDKNFSNLMRKVNTKANLWGAVMASKNWSENTKLPFTGLEGMKSGFFSVDYDKNFTLVFTGLVEQAKQLPRFVEGMKNFLDAFKGWTASVPEFTELLNKAAIQDDKKQLARIVLAVPASEFKNSMTKLSERVSNKEKK